MIPFHSMANQPRRPGELGVHPANRFDVTVKAGDISEAKLKGSTLLRNLVADHPATPPDLVP